MNQGVNIDPKVNWWKEFGILRQEGMSGEKLQYTMAWRLKQMLVKDT